jgi:choloylglycine hydrolase
MKLYFFIRLSLCLAFFTPILNFACTGIQLKANDGSYVNGRTVEFGLEIDLSAIVIPRGYSFIGTTPEGHGLPYQSKYAVVGAITYNDLSVVDGLNEKGLSVGTFYFPGFAEYATIDSHNQSKALSPTEFPNWLLTQFSTVDEVKQGLSGIVIAPTVMESWGPAPPPFHYIVYDRFGHCLVIEPLGGKLVTYENVIGTFTNSPTFDWHLNNLRNYINLRTENVSPLTVNGVILAPFGQGSGMVGMPGDFTPPSRFVRASIFSYTAIPSDNAGESVLQVFHILNQFDIPIGIAKETTGNIVHTDYTLATCVRDPQSLKYYFKTYDDQSIRMIDLNQFDLNAKKIKIVSFAGKEKIMDISSQLK